MGPGRVLWRGFPAYLSGESVVQEGRLQPFPGSRYSEPRHQRQCDLLTTDLRRIAKAAVPAAQRFSRAQGYPRLRRAERTVYGREQIVLSHRSAGNNPQEVDHRKPGDDGCL